MPKKKVKAASMPEALKKPSYGKKVKWRFNNYEFISGEKN